MQQIDLIGSFEKRNFPRFRNPTIETMIWGRKRHHVPILLEIDVTVARAAIYDAAAIFPRPILLATIVSQSLSSQAHDGDCLPINGLPDMAIPQIDSVNRSGNHVILRCGDIDVLLAHFRPQSLSVQTGMKVQVGDRIAEVGNSGASDEPHLHIHAQQPESSNPLSGNPMLMRFNGRFLIRGDRVAIPK